MPLRVITTPNISEPNCKFGLPTEISIKIISETGDIEDYISSFEMSWFKAYKLRIGTHNVWDIVSDAIFVSVGIHDGCAEGSITIQVPLFEEGYYKIEANISQVIGVSSIQTFDWEGFFTVSNDQALPDINQFCITPEGGYAPLTVKISPINSTFFSDSDEATVSWEYKEEKSYWKNFSGIYVINSGNYPNEEFSYLFDKVGSYSIKLVVNYNNTSYDVIYPRCINVIPIVGLEADFDIFPSKPYVVGQNIYLVPKLYNNYPADSITSLKWYDYNNIDGVSGYISETRKFKLDKRGTHLFTLRITGGRDHVVCKEKKLIVYPGAERKAIKAYISPCPDSPLLMPSNKYPKFKFKADGYYKNSGTASGSTVGVAMPYLYNDSNLFFAIKINGEYNSGYNFLDKTYEVGNLDYIFDKQMFIGNSLTVTEGNYTFPICGLLNDKEFGSYNYFVVEGSPYSSTFAKIASGSLLTMDTTECVSALNRENGMVSRNSSIVAFDGENKKQYYRALIRSREISLDFVDCHKLYDSGFYSNYLRNNFPIESDASGAITEDVFKGYFWINDVIADNNEVEAKTILTFFSIIGKDFSINNLKINNQFLIKNEIKLGVGISNYPNNLFKFDIADPVTLHSAWNSIEFVVRSINPISLGKYPELKFVYKRTNDNVYYTVQCIKTDQSKITVEMENDSLEVINIVDKDKSSRDALYFVILNALKTSKLYFAPRGWGEAGQISKVERVNKNGFPMVELELPKRVSKYYKGMEEFGIYDLINYDNCYVFNNIIRPYGCVFSAINKKNIDVIRLYSANKITFEDPKWGNTVEKDGIGDCPIILFAQSSREIDFQYSTIYNQQNINNNFEQFSFNPFLTLLRQDEFMCNADSTYRFLALTYDATKYNDKLEYYPSHVHYISPFDIDSLKFRDRQDLSTRFYWLEKTDLFTSPSGWGTGDILNKVSGSLSLSGRPSWTSEGVPYDYKTTGSLFLKAVSGSLIISSTSGYMEEQFNSIDETIAYSDLFKGVPTNIGVSGDWSSYYKRAFLSSMNHVFSNYGSEYASRSSSSVQRSYYSINDYQFHGFVGDACMGVQRPLEINAKNLLNAQIDIISKISNNNRYIVFASTNKLYLYDQYFNTELGPYKVVDSFKDFNIGDEDIYNVTNVPKIKVRYFQPSVSGIGDFKNTVDINPPKNNIVTNIPYSSKYFGGDNIVVNTNYYDQQGSWQVLGGKLGNVYSKQNAQNLIDVNSIDFGVGVDVIRDETESKIFSFAVDENKIFFTSQTAIGISTLGENSYYYKVNKNDYSISEEMYGASRFNINDQSSQKEKNVFYVHLNPENTRQTVMIKGNREGVSFNVSSSIYLSDIIKPVLNYGNNKILIEKDALVKNVNFMFSTRGWFPDKAKVCITKLKTIDDYQSYFKQAFPILDMKTKEYNGQYESAGVVDIAILKDNVGSHCFTLGLEHRPLASQFSDKFSANYLQNDIDELTNNFSSNFIIINESDITVNTKVERTSKNIIIIKPSIRCLTIKATLENVRYDQQLNMTIIKYNYPQRDNLEISGIKADNNRRYCGCTLCFMKSTRMSRYIICDSTETELFVNGNMSSYLFLDEAEKILCIAPFIPKYILIYNKIGNESNQGNLQDILFNESKLKTSLGNSPVSSIFNVEFNGTPYAVENASFCVDLIDSPSDFVYTTQHNVNVINSSIGGMIENVDNYAECMLYYKYDVPTQIFSQPIGNASLTSGYEFFNMLKYVDASGYIVNPLDMYVKIKFANAVICNNSSFKMETFVYNEVTGGGNFVPTFASPYSYSEGSPFEPPNIIYPIGGNIQQEGEDIYADTFAVKLSGYSFGSSAQKKEIRFVITATDKFGKEINFGTISKNIF